VSLPTRVTSAAAAFALTAALGVSTAAGALSPAGQNAARPVWVEPVPGLAGRVVEDFDAPLLRWQPGHRGIDFAVAPEELISSPAAGSVHFVGRVVNRPILTIVDSAGQLASFEPVCSNLSVGEAVSAGSVIGWHCEADLSYEPHCPVECVHFSARRDGNYLSPLHLIFGLAPSRLWPPPPI
jgi:murein DD-endopeptidase MepM/ murein hydrolase activator NlpD